jgi:hypothetical protein
MKYFILILLAFFTWTTSSAQSADEHYNAAYEELKGMLEGTAPYSFKRAVFITENAYLDNSLNYDAFNNIINVYSRLSKKIAEDWSLTYNEEDKAAVAKNAAIYYVMRDSIPVLGAAGDTTFTIPFRYDFEDIWGDKDWTKMFVSKLLVTRTGNCHSLPYLYKILAEEIGAKAYLSLAPHHVYIKNWSKRDGWYNTELTSGYFPIDAWIMASGYIHLSAIQNGIYMDTLSNQQSLALCLLDLAKGYERKYDDTQFVLQCAELALQYYPHCANALLLKGETLKKQFEGMMKQLRAEYPKDLFDMPEAKALFDEMNKTYLKAHQLGYRTMPKEMYLAWLTELEQEKEKYINPKIKY